MTEPLDAVVVGSGPNGLAAAVALAMAGRSVTVLEAAPTAGGGARSAELTEPGLVHDTCSGVHPFGVASPFLSSLPLAEHGLVWRWPEVDLAHPFDDGTAALMHRDIDRTCDELGADGKAWGRLFGPLARRTQFLVDGPTGVITIGGADLLPTARALRVPNSGPILGFAKDAAHIVLLLDVKWLVERTP